MTLLTDAEITGMRSTIDDSLPDTATHQTVTETADGMGGHSRAWATVTTYACRLSPMGALERVLGSRWASVGDWVITLTHDAAVEVDDRLLVSGRTFTIKALPVGRSWELSRRAICVEVL